MFFLGSYRGVTNDQNLIIVNEMLGLLDVSRSRDTDFVQTTSDNNFFNFVTSDTETKSKSYFIS